MKISFIIPMLDDYDVEVAYRNIEKACSDTDVDFDVIFAINNKLNVMFMKVRNIFVENKRVKAFMTDREVNQHKLITLAMQDCEDYDAVVIYSGKEETNVDVIKAFIESWKAGNKIVYLKKVYRGFARVWASLKGLLYKIGVLVLGIFKDIGAENDIQLLDQDVVKTINQLPNKNQLLRTLDSLIYSSTDIIHLQVDPNEYINQLYTEKQKTYYNNAIISYVALFVAMSSALASSLLLGLNIDVSLLSHVAMWSAFALSFFMWVVFSTKKTLALRVGKEFDLQELKNIKAQTEYYNF